MSDSYKTVDIHISALETGMTILVNGELMTVNRPKQVKNGFTGWCFEGDPFYQTRGFVKRVLFPKWYKGEIVFYI